jgi:hypothetical protein
MKWEVRESGAHRVDRVPGFLSSRPNWLPPPPLRKLVLHPPGSKGAGGGGVGDTLGGMGAREANSDEKTDPLVI